ncbi:UNVERIFIED_CONTAM: hypothetical protein GTU68_060019 [Idotea baltica]|nr:hypothetical protein [Idotea baltica]
MSLRRVVVTGTSVVTSLGYDVEAVWSQVCNGRSGISLVQRFDCREFRVRIGGEIKDFKLTDHMTLDTRALRRMDRFAQFAMVAADKAIAQSGLDFCALDTTRCGAIVGSGIGGLDEIEDQHSRLFDRGPERISAFMIPKLMVNAASGNISVHWELKGPSLAICTACASAAQSIGSAYHLIQLGAADLMICGGSEAPMTPMGLSGFTRMNALSTRNESPELASRPFDEDRDGFVLSEGAGLLLLEEYEHAKNRGANILAELVGYGTSSDGHHMTAPDQNGGGAARAMQAALDAAKLDPSQIDYVNAHGTSTLLGDKAETAAIRTVFQSHADAMSVSSTKSQLGHVLGASGAIESVFCVKALQDQLVPPTINLDRAGEGCDLDYVPNEAREQKVQYTLNNSFGFGGHNACLVFGRI